MLPQRTALVFLLIIISVFGKQVSKFQVTKWVIMKGGSLRVDGSTNINKFSCEITRYAKPDTVVVYKNTNKESLRVIGFLILEVQNFNCHNRVMTSDLRKTLKAKEFPRLTIRFLNLSKYPDLNAPQDLIKGAVAIELAGVTKQLEVDYKFTSSAEDVINLIGARQVNFSDFNITPPRKIGGMIQTNEGLKVVFNLRIKIIDFLKD